jgi:pyroglutamyl-peptidase
MKILITGFQPFGGEKVNPSYEAVKLLPDSIAGAEVIKADLSVVFGLAIEELDALIARHDPDVVLCTGQAGGRTHMSVERIAINCDDGRIPDNAGYQPKGVPTVEGGPAAYFATVPIKAMVAAMKTAGVPAEVSNTAGTYVCNHIMYGCLHLLATKYSQKRGGFIHVPYIPEQVLEKKNTASMPLELIAKGFEMAIKAAVENETDIQVAAGAEM